MKWISFLMMMVLAGSLAPEAAFALGDKKASLEFLPEHAIKDQTIELDEICDIQCDDPYFFEQLRSITIARTPQPGRERTLTKYEVLTSLKKAGISLQDVKFTGQIQTRFSFQSETLYSTEIARIAKDYVFNETGYETDDVIFEIMNAPQDILIPKGAKRFEVYPLSTSALIGSCFLSVNIIVNDRIIETVPVTMNIRLFKDVLVTKRNLIRGEKLTPNDFEVKRREVTRYKKGLVECFEDISELVPRRIIRSQQVLTMDMLEQPEIIKKGELVKIVLESGSLTVTARGIALGSGKKGEIIQVRNVDSKRVITAVVSGEGQVRLSI